MPTPTFAQPPPMLRLGNMTSLSTVRYAHLATHSEAVAKVFLQRQGLELRGAGRFLVGRAAEGTGMHVTEGVTDGVLTDVHTLSSTPALPDSPSDTAVSVVSLLGHNATLSKSLSAHPCSRHTSSQGPRTRSARSRQPGVKAGPSQPPRASRYDSLQLLMQVAAFVSCRSGKTLGEVLSGDVEGLCELDVWEEWHRYKTRLEEAYVASLATWQEQGFLSNCGGYTTSSAWAT